MKKLLTSILAISFAMPAMADITAQSTCDTNALGQSDNNSTANVEAIWNAISYTCTAGQYLESDNVTCTTCPSGSYCGGFENIAFADADIGVNGCPTGYANSAAGATAQGQCYNPGTATCSTRNPYSGANPSKTSNIVYGNSTNGSASCKTYYGDTTTCVLDTANACEITDITCATGYRKERVAVAGASNPLVIVNLATDSSNLATDGSAAYGKGYYNNEDRCWAYNSDSDSWSTTSCTSAPFTSMQYNDWQTEFSYGTVKGRASCNGTNAPKVTAVRNRRQQILMAQFQSGAITQQKLLDQMTAMYYETSAEYGVNPNANFSASSTGRYCWCQTESFTPTNGSTVGASSSWVFNGDFSTASNCANTCAYNCANYVQNSRVFRRALYGSVGSLQCVANSININWYNENEIHESNQCTYDGTITLPSTNPTKVGYTFSGWKLRTTND